MTDPVSAAAGPPCICTMREPHPPSECVKPGTDPADVVHDDLVRILEALDLGTHGRPYSSHSVVHREVLPAIAKLRGEASPHVARQVADLTAEVERLTRALRDKVEAVREMCDAAETPPGYVSPEWRQAVLEGDASPMLLVRDIRRVLGTTPPTEGAVE
jgi:hypothetical protein